MLKSKYIVKGWIFMENKLLIFDCFGVLCQEISPKWFRMHFSDEEAKILKPKFFNGADRGDIDIYELVDRISNYTKIPSSKILEEWKMIFNKNDELLNYIRKLKGKYHICLLSNVVKGFVNFLFEDPNYLSNIFDKTFNSWEYHTRKPEKEFYKICIDSYKDYNFDKIYFIDDNEKNLVGLEEFKITPHLYISNEELFEFFRNEGIKIDE